MPALLPPWLTEPPAPLVGWVLLPAVPVDSVPPSELQCRANNEKPAVAKMKAAEWRREADGMRMGFFPEKVSGTVLEEEWVSEQPIFGPSRTANSVGFGCSRARSLEPACSRLPSVYS
jgi:hypothetical protein